MPCFESKDLKRPLPKRTCIVTIRFTFNFFFFCLNVNFMLTIKNFLPAVNFSYSKYKTLNTQSEPYLSLRQHVPHKQPSMEECLLEQTIYYLQPRF